MKLFVKIIVFCAAFAGGVWASDYIPAQWWEFKSWPAAAVRSSPEISSKKIEEVYNVLDRNYLYTDELSKTASLEKGAAKGMVNALDDPYTTYFSAKKYDTFQQSLKGKFEGIGARIGIRNDQLVIISPLAGMPAEKAGLRAGDKILRIDETTTENMSVDRAVTLIRGKKGTDVTLTIKRDGRREPKEITITRGSITVPDVKGSVKQGVAHVEITQFKSQTAQHVRKTVSEELKKTDTNKLILDLRNNGGGVLQAAIGTVGLFVKEDSVAVKEKKRGGEVEAKHTNHRPQFQDVQNVVLVNEASASAAEIVAGGLRDLKGTTVLGQQTFGKGSVQEIKQLSDGSALKVTIAEWLTPNGTNINKEGLSPDISVERTKEDINAGDDPQLQRALEEVK
jgi:carboxyl-terminal processing protease